MKDFPIFILYFLSYQEKPKGTPGLICFENFVCAK